MARDVKIWKEDGSFLQNTTLRINNPNNIKAFSVKLSCLDFCNNRTKYKNKNLTLDIKFINAYKINIDDYSFGIIRISFKQSDITLDTCIKIVNLLSQTRSSTIRDNMFITPKKTFNLTHIIHTIFEISKDTEIIEPRLNAFAFFRISEKNEFFLNNSLNALFNYKESSSRLNDTYANENNTIKLIEALITLSSNGSSLICKPNYADNNSQLQERFFKQFLFLYLLGKVQIELIDKGFSASKVLSFTENICLVDSEKEFYKKWLRILRNKNGNF